MKCCSAKNTKGMNNQIRIPVALCNAIQTFRLSLIIHTAFGNEKKIKFDEGKGKAGSMKYQDL